MSTLSGMEKFSYLEDKIYLTVEYVKKLREEKDSLERELVTARGEAAAAISDRQDADQRITELLSERDTILLKVESMLEALSSIDREVAAVVNAKSNGR